MLFYITFITTKVSRSMVLDIIGTRKLVNVCCIQLFMRSSLHCNTATVYAVHLVILVSITKFNVRQWCL